MKNDYRGLLRAERPNPSSVRARGKHIKSNTETHRAQRKHSFERGLENNMYGKNRKRTFTYTTSSLVLEKMSIMTLKAA